MRVGGVKATGKAPLKFKRHRELNERRAGAGGGLDAPFVDKQREYGAADGETRLGVVKMRAEHLSLAVAFTRVGPPGVCDMETRDTYLETKSQHDDARA
jgi:hypothetical protein